MVDDNTTDDKVTPIDNKQGAKDPKQAALNKIKEATTKEWNTKIEAQVKKTVDAKKIYVNTKKELVELLSESEDSKSEFADMIKDI